MMLAQQHRTVSTDHLGNVRATVSDMLLPRGSGVFDADLRTLTDYYPFGMTMPGRTLSSEDYRYGYNTQERVDEIAGEGKHYTAEYWEYDPRAARRWNLDPVIQPATSGYSAFSLNPNVMVDPKGDSSYFNADGQAHLQEGLDRIFNEAAPNPFSFDSRTRESMAAYSKLLVSEDLDRSLYNEVQLEVIDRLSSMAKSSDFHTLSIGTGRDVPFNDAFRIAEVAPEGYGGSLATRGLSGATFENSMRLDGRPMSLIFTANDPVTTSRTVDNRTGITLLTTTIPAPRYERGLHHLHELGGHAWGATRGITNTNAMAEQFETRIRSIYRVGTTSINGVVSPQFLGGTAPPHR